MKKILFYMIVCLMGLTSCKYLDVVPEGQAAFSDLFKTEYQCRKFVNGLYSEIPIKLSYTEIPEWCAGDDFITGTKGTIRWFPYKSILYGEENANTTYFQYWQESSTQAGARIRHMYRAIRYCYLLLDNISSVPNISEENYNYWRGEALYLIAFYHQMLLEYYGPVVLEKQSLSLNSTESEMYLPRNTYDECVDFICNKYDEACKLLPAKRIDAELGLPSQVVAKAYKARLLLMAASKQFNGNSADYASFKNPDGTCLMSQTYDREKWKKALDAAQEAITLAEANGCKLYTNPTDGLSTFDQGVKNYHDTFCENISVSYPEEFIAAGTDVTWSQYLQRDTGPHVTKSYNGSTSFCEYLVPTFEAVEMYYSKNGLPMDVDPLTKDLNLYSVADGDSTALLHRNREPRFNASIGYDRGLMDFNGGTMSLHCRGGEMQGVYLTSAGAIDASKEYQTCTGYCLKKYLHKSVYYNPTTRKMTYRDIVTPLLRLSELYLNYAEADFEYNGSLSQQSLTYLNKIRTRCGLPHFEDSWALVGGIPQGDKLRDVLHQERSIELLYEGHRYWDIRRWGEAKDIMSKTPKAWNLKGKTQKDFYQLSTMQEVGTRVFESPKNIWLAIPLAAMNVNYNLVQNPGY